MVHRVVSNALSNGKHRIVELGRFGPLKAHPLVARDVDDEAARSEKIQVLGSQI